MWEQTQLHPLVVSLGRRLLIFVAAVLATLLVYSFALSPVASAEDVSWQDDGSIIYEDQEFTRVNDDNAHELLGINSESIIFSRLTDDRSKAEFIYFSNQAEADTGDSAQWVSYDWSPPDELSNREGPVTVAVTPRAESSEDVNENTSSCEVEGIGWIVCPVTGFLARGTDWLFNILSEFLSVPPLLTDTDTPLYRTWRMMLGLANLAFIAAFIIIIYSQITSIGLSNYGIKRLLPRLIIAAVLVNISYYICAIAVDASNILGFELQNMFIDMRNSVVGEGGNGWQIVKWEDVAVTVLAGSAAAGIAGGIAFASLSASPGALFLLLPTLVGVVLAVLVAILVLAARQAIITVLIILAPLAFVAYLLPNTEKWFEKWRGTFMTMLLLFPVFSVLFGGAQLAGTAIIHNARETGSLTVLILGMATQIAPIVITPFLVKFSGSLLGRIAGMVNNPNKGLIDRTRNFAKDQAEHRKLKRSRDVMKNPPKKHQLMRRTARGLEMRRRKREDEASLWKQQAETGYERAKTTNRNLQWLNIDSKQAALDSEQAKRETDRVFEDLRAGSSEGVVDIPVRRVLGITINPGKLAADAVKRAQASDTDKRVVENQIREAQSQQLSNFSNELADNEALRIRAGGVAGFEGAQSAYTNAITAIRKEYNENVAERTQLIRHFNLSSGERQKLALGEDVTKTHNGRTFTFRAADIYAREAAIEDQLKTGSEGQIAEIIKESGAVVDENGNIVKKGKTFDYRTTVSQAIPSNGIPGKALIFGNKTIDDVSQGTFYGESSMFNAAVYNIAEGKIRDDVLAVQGAETLRILYESGEKLRTDPNAIEQFKNLSDSKKEAFWVNYEALKRSAYKILEDPVNRNSTESARKIFEKYQVKAEKEDLPNTEDGEA